MNRRPLPDAAQLRRQFNRNTLIWGIPCRGVNVAAVPPYRFPKTIFSDLGGKLVTALRKARRDAGLTQVQAAEKLGCRQTFISKIECGERRIDVIEFVTICDAYGVAPGRLLDSLVNGVKTKIRPTRSAKKRQQ